MEMDCVGTGTHFDMPIHRLRFRIPSAGEGRFGRPRSNRVGDENSTADGEATLLSYHVTLELISFHSFSLRNLPCLYLQTESGALKMAGGCLMPEILQSTSLVVPLARPTSL